MPAILNKICIDSRFKTFDSVSNTDFKIELKEGYLVPDNFGAVITDVCIPRSWYTIEDYNNKLYFSIHTGGDNTDYIAYVDPQNYDIQSLAVQLQGVMNTAVGSPVFTCTPLVSKGVILFDCLPSYMYKVWSDKDLKSDITRSIWTGPAYDPNNLQSVNNVLSHTSTTVLSDRLNPFVTGFINTLPHESIYVVSNQLSTNENVGPDGRGNVLKRVTVDNTPFGSVISNPWMNELDFTNVSRQLLKTLHFRITDPYGNILNLHGAHVSFSIVLIQIPAEY